MIHSLKDRLPHLFQNLLQVAISLLGGEFQLHNKSVHLIDDQNGRDVFKPSLAKHNLGLQKTQTCQRRMNEWHKNISLHLHFHLTIHKAMNQNAFLSTGRHSLETFCRDCTWGHTPSTASTTTMAPSHSLIAVETSEEKSTWPGESIRLTK